MADSFLSLNDVVGQIRELVQDTDASAAFRYTTSSIVKNINMGLMEMYRIRPDIFLKLNFAIPTYDSAFPDALLTIEQQFIPSLIYYATGLTQLRDDEGTQDARASAFLAKFTSMLVSVA